MSTAALPATRPLNAGTTLRTALRQVVDFFKANRLFTAGVVLLFLLWLLGFIGHFGGALIHLLLVIAVVVLIVNLISGRRSL